MQKHLAFHAADVAFFWRRGNVWMATGMRGLLSSLPADNKDLRFEMASSPKQKLLTVEIFN